MPTRRDDSLTEPNPEAVGDELFEAGNVGLPDLPGKTQLTENEMNIPAYPAQADAPYSMTEAVMENLRVGVGATSPEDQDQPEE